MAPRSPVAAHLALERSAVDLLRGWTPIRLSDRPQIVDEAASSRARRRLDFGRFGAPSTSGKYPDSERPGLAGPGPSAHPPGAPMQRSRE